MIYFLFFYTLMKRLLTTLSLLFCLSLVVKAQNSNDTVPLYKQIPALPKFNLLMLDSQKIVNTGDIPSGKAIMLILFSPDCHHCEEMTDKIIANIKKLQHIRIVMLTPMSIAMTKEFYERKQLSKYRNIIVGKDYEFFFPKYYNAYDIPFVALYDRKKLLIQAFDQTATFEEIVDAAL